MNRKYTLKITKTIVTTKEVIIEAPEMKFEKQARALALLMSEGHFGDVGGCGWKRELGTLIDIIYKAARERADFCSLHAPASCKAEIVDEKFCVHEIINASLPIGGELHNPKENIGM